MKKPTAMLCFQFKDGEVNEVSKMTVLDNQDFSIIMQDEGQDGKTYGHLTFDDGQGNQFNMFMKRI